MPKDTIQPKIRSHAQNNSLHKWCEEMAVELNNAGIGIDVLFKNVQADHTKDSVKFLWQGFAMAKYGKDGTSKLTTKEIQEVFEEVNRHIAQWGLHLPWPSQEQTTNYINSFNE